MAKILIVEDNQGTNKAICEYMKEAGHTLFLLYRERSVKNIPWRRTRYNCTGYYAS